MSTSYLERALSQLKLPKTDWVGLREVKEVTTHRYVRDGKPQANNTVVSHGIMVEVLADGQFGYAATSRMDPESLQAAAVQARNQALAAARYRIFEFTPAQRPPVKMTYRSPVQQLLSTRTAGEINSLLIKISQ